MGKLAYIFPGQGSQHPGMGKDFYDNSGDAKNVFERANKALGDSISGICFEGTEEQLALTANTQPAILTMSVAAHHAFKAAGAPEPDYVAGHSLGEYSALVVGGGIGLEDAVRTVRQRGEFMQEAVPLGVGAMAAVLGLSGEMVAEVCAGLSVEGVCSPANLNSPKQTVVAGDKAAVESACEELKKAGARRTVLLNVSAPFHCDLMMPAQNRLEEVLGALEFSDLEIPLVENVSGEINSDGKRVPIALTEQVSGAVRWQPGIEKLIEEGVDTFVEVGPGKVLTGLVRQINRNVKFYNVFDQESLSNTLEKLSH